MNRLAALGRILFALGLVGFGVIQLIVGDVVAGRAPAWPASLPGQAAWAYGTAGFLILAAAAIATERGGRVASLAVGTFIFAWALIRNVPIAAASPALSGEWTTAGKSLVLFAGAFAVAGSLPEKGGAGAFTAFLNSREAFLRLGQFALALFMILCGIQHFIYDVFVATLVPAWMPGTYFWTYFAGVALIAGGIGLLAPWTWAPAALLSGLMIFSWVWLVHLPRSLSAAFDSRNEWTSTFEALALSGLAILLFTSHRHPPPVREPAHPENVVRRTTRPAPRPGR